jgi:uncharacterized membrane protein YkoI
MKWITAVTIVPAVLIAADLALAGDDLSFDELPAPVQATVRKEVMSGQISEIERDVKRGQAVYEIEFVDRGTKYEIEVAPDGRLLDRKED